jgi:TonB family protein
MGFMARNLRYPVVAQQNNIQGKVIASFIVSSTGKVINPEILRSVDPSLDKEAIRVISTFPDFIPGEQNDKKVAVRYTIPVVFRLDGSTTPAPALDPNEKPIVVVGYGARKEEQGVNLNNLPDGAKPLYIIDGKVATESERNLLLPSSIKSIDVLKAKSATSIYGEAGKDGVLVITTKNQTPAK